MKIAQVQNCNFNSPVALLKSVCPPREGLCLKHEKTLDKEFLLCNATRRVADWLTSFISSHADWPYRVEELTAVDDLPRSLV